ncbi:16S rRNA (guanine(966)-N(2))-methyltransferase RsmD [Pacificimonas flava]|uniref:16S rRNA (Guanine(966)-N(2))-methyltransferase RsmD n=3 Tax=Pacificimonas TaxID=1960290 RepID=A0A219B6U6_9SPHN|nr:16S rRNA (guanine(966)-N(2))-methyltransferase RsmD [Pacificimonas flava]MBZ6378636.1 16S rRNA (guanine(966)-N(2))-methyltransferase RsmD [Pacificimonas aurantium]OWV34090.1 16S rRNA (guanine(966)-N(2))-methyltransferase RsmD [Pacificimonas flava]
MKIIAGQWRGRTMTPPPSSTTRPTSARAREALFSSLTSKLGTFEGLRVADLFAGTGALGLEALSRGAAHCRFVENEPRALAVLRRNVANLRAQALSEIQTSDVLQVRQATVPFDLLFLDPPYEKGLAAPALERLAERGWTSASTLAVVETAREQTLQPVGWNIEGERIYGAARLSFLRCH